MGAYLGADQEDLVGVYLQWAEQARRAVVTHPFPLLTHLLQDGLKGLGANSHGKVIILWFPLLLA